MRVSTSGRKGPKVRLAGWRALLVRGRPAGGGDEADEPVAAGRERVSREDEAQAALGNTVVTPGVAWGLVLGFLLTLGGVPLVGWLMTPRTPSGEGGTPFRLAGLLDAQEYKGLERRLESRSPIRAWVRPQAQALLTRLGAGNAQVCVGRDGWLAYRPDLDYLTGRGFLDAGQLARRGRGDTIGGRAVEGEGGAVGAHSDPIPAILHFREQLAQRGIRLVMMPVPPKPMLYPEEFGPVAGGGEPPQNPSYDGFVEELRQNGVLVCDPTRQLVESGRRTGRAQFLRTDTHWTPEGVEVAAANLADFLQRRVALSAGQVLYQRGEQRLAQIGDIAAMLKLPQDQGIFAPQAVTIHPVTALGGAAWRPAREAEVLLLGDSFSNIYTLDKMNWGTGAGLAEQLAFDLQRPVDRIAVNGGGASGARQRLCGDLWREQGRGRDRLTGKRVVVWEFAMRDLMNGDWQLLDLPGAASAPAPDAEPRSTPAPEATAQATPTLRAAESGRQPSPPAVVAVFRRALSRQAAGAERGGSHILRGTDGWMFYLPDVYYVAGRGFLRGGSSPQVTALTDFGRQLARRGIKLIVVPVPAKPTIYPEMLGLDVPMPQAPENPSAAAFRQALEGHGIRVFDPTETLLREKQRVGTGLFMPTDSHWTFLAVDSVARDLAEVTRQELGLPEGRPVAYRRRAATVRNITDISLMLPPVNGVRPFIRVSQTVQQVLTPQDRPWYAASSADIIIMGDSFTNIYGRGGYWGQGAGIAEQLSYYLGRPVDRIAMERGAVNNIRLALRRDLLQGRDRLAGKKLVIYEVASRYLLERDWQMVRLPEPAEAATIAGRRRGALPTPAPRPRTTATPPAMVTPTATANVVQPPVLVSGVIKACTIAPAPETTPYGDLIIALRLKNLQSAAGSDSAELPGGDVVVYLWGMRNHALTEAANWRVGQSVSLRLTPWETVEDKYGDYDRMELEGRRISRLPAFWGEDPATVEP